jgi:hypothetical protein
MALNMKPLQRPTITTHQQLDNVISIIELMGGEVVGIEIEVDQLEKSWTGLAPGFPPTPMWVWAPWNAEWRLTGYLLVTGLPNGSGY